MGVLKTTKKYNIPENFNYEKARKLFLHASDDNDFNEIKDNLKLTRRVLIPLLEEMDNEGFFERKGESRFVLKTS